MPIPPHCHHGLRHCLRSEGLLNPQLPSQLRRPHHRLVPIRGIGKVETVENFSALITVQSWRQIGEKLPGPGAFVPSAQALPVLLGVVEKSRPWDDLLELVSRWLQTAAVCPAMIFSQKPHNFARGSGAGRA